MFNKYFLDRIEGYCGKLKICFFLNRYVLFGGDFGAGDFEGSGCVF